MSSKKQQQRQYSDRITYDTQNNIVRVEVYDVIDSATVASRSANNVPDLRDIFADFSHLVSVTPERIAQAITRFEGMLRDKNSNDGVAFHQPADKRVMMPSVESVADADDWKSLARKLDAQQRDAAKRASVLATVEIPQNPTMSELLRVAALQSKFSLADRLTETTSSKVFLVKYFPAVGKYTLMQRSFKQAMKEWRDVNMAAVSKSINLGVVRDGVILAQLKNDPLVRDTQERN